MVDEKPTPRTEPRKGYRTKQFNDLVSWTQYECTHPECDMGAYSRFDTSDEAVMQEHQAQAHAEVDPNDRLRAMGLVKP